MLSGACFHKYHMPHITRSKGLLQLELEKKGCGGGGGGGGVGRSGLYTRKAKMAFIMHT